LGEDSREQVTRLIAQLGASPDARDRLLEVVYRKLHDIAERHMGDERAGHTLQATALVHEAYVRLLGDHEMTWQDRGAFFAAAAEAMRRILIDHARRRGSAKRGAGKKPAALSDVAELAAAQDPGEILALDEALTRLSREDARAARVVELRFFAGLEVEETARALGLSERTVMREWAFARARLFELLETGP
jgi:RNA polymerase sigma factor (TIGR02999 family)